MQFAQGIDMMRDHFGKDPTLEELKAIEGDEALKGVAEQLANIMSGQEATFAELAENIQGAKEYFDGQLNYYYNVDLTPGPRSSAIITQMLMSAIMAIMTSWDRMPVTAPTLPGSSLLPATTTLESKE